MEVITKVNSSAGTKDANGGTVQEPGYKVESAGYDIQRSEHADASFVLELVLHGTYFVNGGSATPINQNCFVRMSTWILNFEEIVELTLCKWIINVVVFHAPHKRILNNPS